MAPKRKTKVAADRPAATTAPARDLNTGPRRLRHLPCFYNETRLRQVAEFDSAGKRPTKKPRKKPKAEGKAKVKKPEPKKGGKRNTSTKEGRTGGKTQGATTATTAGPTTGGQAQDSDNDEPESPVLPAVPSETQEGHNEDSKDEATRQSFQLPPINTATSLFRSEDGDDVDVLFGSNDEDGESNNDGEYVMNQLEDLGVRTSTAVNSAQRADDLVYVIIDNIVEHEAERLGERSSSTKAPTSSSTLPSWGATGASFGAAEFEF